MKWKYEDSKNTLTNCKIVHKAYELCNRASNDTDFMLYRETSNVNICAYLLAPNHAKKIKIKKNSKLYTAVKIEQ